MDDKYGNLITGPTFIAEFAQLIRRCIRAYLCNGHQSSAHTNDWNCLLKSPLAIRMIDGNQARMRSGLEK